MGRILFFHYIIAILRLVKLKKSYFDFKNLQKMIIFFVFEKVLF